MAKFGVIFLLVFCLLTSLVKSTLTSMHEKENSVSLVLPRTLPHAVNSKIDDTRGQEDDNEVLSSSISSSFFSKSPSSSLMISSSVPVDSFQSSSTSKPLSTQTKLDMKTSSLSSIDSQSMDEDSEAESLPPTTSTTEQPLSSSLHLPTSSYSLSTSSILTSSLTSIEEFQQDDNDDLEDDTELIRTESIQEARLAKKKQRATPQPSKEKEKTVFENGLAHPQENTHIKNSPVIQNPNDQGAPDNNNSSSEMNSEIIADNFQSSRAENNNENQDAPGLGKVGTALLSVGGVLMVAGITGGIFVWRAQQQQQGLPQHKSPTPSILMSSPGHHQHCPTALNLLDESSNSAGKCQTPPPTPLSKAPHSQTMFDINHQGSPSASTDFASFERHDLMNNWQNGLDFNYSMEKLFNNHTRSPNHPSVKNIRASPVQGRMDEKTQVASPSISTAHHPLSSSSSTQLHNTNHNLSTSESSNQDKHETNDADDHAHEEHAQGLHAASPISIYFPSSSPPPSSPPLLQQECKVKINLVHKDT
ncbi:hypothetical protein BCR42DRAFT_470610 [Absidia repens]|uniref:Mid2 domain-containing protein n=1 Tax=Absidia repens TaxID=90262 RepID=A0A1X2I4K2_9FUNG|nr:hypothetical protein BCR42DRAFT_470610 [Absidia repens]